MLVSIYYIVRATMLIFPKWENHQVGTKVSEVSQLTIFVMSLIQFCMSYKDEKYLQLVKYVLYLQIV